jgi:hypothetical protein
LILVKNSDGSLHPAPAPSPPASFVSPLSFASPPSFASPLTGLPADAAGRMLQDGCCRPATPNCASLPRRRHTMPARRHDLLPSCCRCSAAGSHRWPAAPNCASPPRRRHTTLARRHDKLPSCCRCSAAAGHERPAVEAVVGGRALHLDCPGRKPQFLAVKRPARPYKSAIENRFTMERAQVS